MTAALRQLLIAEGVLVPVEVVEQRLTEGRPTLCLDEAGRQAAERARNEVAPEDAEGLAWLNRQSLGR